MMAMTYTLGRFVRIDNSAHQACIDCGVPANEVDDLIAEAKRGNKGIVYPGDRTLQTVHLIKPRGCGCAEIYYLYLDQQSDSPDTFESLMTNLPGLGFCIFISAAPTMETP